MPHPPHTQFPIVCAPGLSLITGRAKLFLPLLPQAFASLSRGDSLDWKDLAAPEITQRVVSRVQPGSICLFHNAALHTPEALPGIIEALLQEGYQIVPVSQLLLTGDYTMDHTGRQCPA